MLVISFAFEIFICRFLMWMFNRRCYFYRRCSRWYRNYRILRLNLIFRRFYTFSFDFFVLRVALDQMSCFRVFSFVFWNSFQNYRRYQYRCHNNKIWYCYHCLTMFHATRYALPCPNRCKLVNHQFLSFYMVLDCQTRRYLLLTLLEIRCDVFIFL